MTALKSRKRWIGFWVPYAAIYAGIYVTSSIFNVFNVTMNNIVTSEGASRTTMCALMTGAVLNVVLDSVFIYTFNLGVAGAAIATAISQIVSTLVYVCYVLRRKSVFSFSIKKYCFSIEVMVEILKIGIPTLVFQLLASLAITLINMRAKEYGDSVIAAMGTVTRIISMGSLVVFGFLKGFQPVAGYSYGAKKYERLREAIKTSTLWSTIFCTIFGLVLALFPMVIISRFTIGDMEMVEVGRSALRANGVSFMLFGFYTVYSTLFLALGKAKEGILYAQPAADVLSFVIAVIMAVRVHREIGSRE